MAYDIGLIAMFTTMALALALPFVEMARALMTGDELNGAAMAGTFGLFLASPIVGAIVQALAS